MTGTAVSTQTAATQQVLQNALQPEGPQAQAIFGLWNFTLALCTVVFAVIVLAFLYALWRAPRGHAGTAPDLGSLARPERRVHGIVLWGTVISAVGLVMLLVADVWTARALARLPLKEAVNIELVGHMWWWEARYLSDDPTQRFTTANELRLPVGRPVLVSLKSRDVIHTLWVPNLAGKRDMIPGRSTTIALQADRPGVYRAQCAEFCGLEHALMALPVTAQAPADYEQWAAAQRKPSVEPDTDRRRRGRDVFLGTTCVMCHTVAGTTARGTLGPDLTHFASRPTLAAGALKNDRANLQAWIVDPQRFKPGANMPAHPFPADDMTALLDYLESLK
ncbi:cytochrome c oxidase subunit 2 [Pseudoduganella lurida]|uniref:cytochrome-c oxidase n=1 Tax=Pseudoduganella lurida TaxID=1036180 RepID=A0A562R7B4_9BURK|nr:cytochrome c oxidase subunit II [Pseudoduganella lurida]TWI64310.1 cytochrome c oxidase subunit 2 [Pseudoduganella lurida]